MIGKILGNRYEILEQIGTGGMAIVYKAKCRLLDRFVAIKILKDEFIDDEEFIRKFKRESQAAASLSHPNIVNIYDVGVEDDGIKKIHYIVMEYISGKNLKEIIKENGAFNLEDTIDYSIQIAEALDNAHRNGIVHRDIKPQNIMLTSDKRVKVTDFGIARAATSSTVTTSSDVLGSVHYFSPEQARGGYTDEKSDIYSLGIVMYEMITGKLPYDGDSAITVALKHVQDDIVPPRELDNTIPVGLESIILKCVQKRQGDRYSNIRDLIKDLKNIDSLSAFRTTESEESELDSNTRIIPIVKDESVIDVKNDKTSKKKNKDKNKDKKPGGGGLMIFLGILLAFLLVTGISLGIARLKGFIQVDEIIVPKIIGLDKAVAKSEIEKLGLKFEIIGTVKDPDFDKDQVVTQSENQGSKVKKGYPIQVTISEGMDLIPVPNVVNSEVAEAESLIKSEGFTVGQPSYEYSETIPINVIIRQKPEAFEKVAPGSRIEFVVSQGTEVKTVIMIQLVGKDINAAYSELGLLGLSVGQVTPEPSDSVEKGIITWQEYGQGNELETGTSVDFIVSDGPPEPVEEEPEEEEPVEEEPVEEPVEVETQITFLVSPPQEKPTTEIKIVRTQDGVVSIQYKKTHNADDGEILIPLKGIKGAQFDVLYDDELQYTEIKKD